MNNQLIAQNLIDCLKREFDLPFAIDVLNKNKETKFRIFPVNDDESLFEVNIRVRDNIRFNATLKPQKYGRCFVASMEHADDSMKAVFKVVVKELITAGCKVNVNLNDSEVDPLEINSWPSHWNKIEIYVTKSPFIFIEGSEEEINNFLGISINVISLFLSLVPIERTDNNKILYEGDANEIKSRKYERNPVARRICIDKYGCRCAICGFDFEKEYGEIGKGFIEVHHIIPVSAIGQQYVINPENDLIPLCSNCHSMIHRKNPPYLPKELVNLKNKR